MKLLHLADLHGNKERADDLLKSLAVAKKTAQGVDLIAIAGDIWDSVLQNSDGSRFNDIREAIRSLADIAPVVMIYGTPTHDTEGSLEVFRTLSSRFGITILEPSRSYFLTEQRHVWDKDFLPLEEVPFALIFGVPEPSKKWIMPRVDEKTEAEASVRECLKGLFLGLGGIRKEYKDLPCVLLYHGQVGGARLQNGDLMDNGSGIRPSIDDLAAVGADYIAMGDIHEPQRVGESIGLQAYYSGSAYPVNFGETHNAGCNLVEIEARTLNGLFPGQPTTFSVDLSRVSFGHPVNQTIRSKLIPSLLGLTEIDTDLKTAVKNGAKVKLEITCNKEDSAQLKAEDFLARLMLAGAVAGSQVVLNVLPTETVRAGEITSKTTLRDKVTLWGENSKKAMAESVLLKADEIEAEATANGSVGRGDKIRLTRLVLRGAIGLWKKSGLDEVDINLEQIDDGLIALIGNNGAGKTTILENMHPWPCLLTRKDTLKDHFRLRDSFRDLYWTDENTGYKYRAFITINAAIASGNTEYWLYRDTGNGFEPMAGIEGRLTAYEKTIDQIFGSKDLYLRSAFVTQRQPRGMADLGDASPAERKALFSALCGTDYLEAYKVIAKAHGDALATQASRTETEIGILSARVPNRIILQADVDHWGSELESAHGDMNILGELGKDKAKVVEALTEQVATNRQLVEKAREAARLADDAQKKVISANSGIDLAQRHLQARQAASEQLAQFADLNSQLVTQNEAYEQLMRAVEAERKVVDSAREKWELSVREERSAYDSKVMDHTQAFKVASEAVAELDYKLRSLTDQEARLKTQLDAPVADHCPTCKQMLPGEALAHVNSAREIIQAELDQLQGDLITLRVEWSTAQTTKQTIESQKPVTPDFPAFQYPASTVPAWSDTERQRIKGELIFIDETQARATISAADQALVRIEELTKQACEQQAIFEREKSRETELRASIRDGIDAELAQAKYSLECAREQYREAQGRQAKASASLEQAQRRIEELANDLAKIEALKQDLVELESEVSEWRLLEFACGDKGIQALELDAVAPSIAAIANGLLRDAFGSRYQIEFQTTRLSGTGKAQKQIEDFLIYVLDTETGDNQEIATLSGGEAVWIRRALYDAFGLIRVRSTGLQFLTVFQDEADGALDPGARLTYLRMVESAHRQAGRRHTIMITHSLELQEMIQTKLEVTKLKPRAEKTSKAA